MLQIYSCTCYEVKRKDHEGEGKTEENVCYGRSVRNKAQPGQEPVYEDPEWVDYVGNFAFSITTLS